jgi:hypothetical protein
MFKNSNKVWFNYNSTTIAYRQTIGCSYNLSVNIGSYLAGLIEGDGHIAVHDKNSKSKVYRPKILRVFNIHDRPLAEKLSAVLKVGKVINKSSAGHVLLQILAKQEVLKIINLISGVCVHQK